MKNIHILPTDKPSRLILQGSELVLSKYKEVNEGFSEFNQHIYITSDEEIKEGYAYYPELNEVLLFDNMEGEVYEQGRQLKVILTTDQYLIKKGVQAIDDEFLEWFVKNPSCEEVEVETEIKWKSTVYDQPDIEDGYNHKIIIPKEEDKQEYILYGEQTNGKITMPATNQQVIDYCLNNPEIMKAIYEKENDMMKTNNVTEVSAEDKDLSYSNDGKK